MSVEQQEQSEGAATVAPDVTSSAVVQSPNGANGQHRTFSREDLRERTGKLPEEWVETPELGEGVGVWVRGLSARAKDKFDQSMIKGKGKMTRTEWDNARAKMVCLSCYDAPQPGGVRVFQDGDETWLGECSVDLLDRLWNSGANQSGMGGAEKSSTVEDAEGN